MTSQSARDVRSTQRGCARVGVVGVSGVWVMWSVGLVGARCGSVLGVVWVCIVMMFALERRSRTVVVLQVGQRSSKSATICADRLEGRDRSGVLGVRRKMLCIGLVVLLMHTARSQFAVAWEARRSWQSLFQWVVCHH